MGEVSALHIQQHGNITILHGNQVLSRPCREWQKSRNRVLGKNCWVPRKRVHTWFDPDPEVLAIISQAIPGPSWIKTGVVWKRDEPYDVLKAVR